MTPIGPTERVKRAFLTGLAALFPILITIFLLSWLYAQMDNLIGSKVNALYRRTLRQNERVFNITFPSAPPEIQTDPEARAEYVEENYPHFIGGVVGITGVALAVLIMGIFLRGYVGNKVMDRVDSFFEKFPVVKGIYPHARQVADMLFGSRGKMELKRVVAVQYPRKGIYSLGFLTGYGLRDVQEQAGENLVSIFIPNSPAPLTGFVIMVPKSEIIDLQMRVEDAIRFCVTAGMVGGNREADTVQQEQTEGKELPDLENKTHINNGEKKDDEGKDRAQREGEV